MAQYNNNAFPIGQLPKGTIVEVMALVGPETSGSTREVAILHKDGDSGSWVPQTKADGSAFCWHLNTSIVPNYRYGGERSSASQRQGAELAREIWPDDISNHELEEIVAKMTPTAIKQLRAILDRNAE